jgi:DNA polymerase-4
MHYRQNNIEVKKGSLVMYVDMNSYFASCEQQEVPEYRGTPMGVVPFIGPNACVIAPSVEAKNLGIKTGMRMPEILAICPHFKPVNARPYIYRRYHVAIMKILGSYCDDVIPRSIDEAVMNMSSYRLVYKDLHALARQIKADILEQLGECIKCSIGIAPNAFLAKLGTEIAKRDGLIELTPDNIDDHLKKMKLQDLPGIASRNERRLLMIGIKDPYEMRHASPALLRKAFGGVVGNYWHTRLNFGEVDLYTSDFRIMSTMRSISRDQRESKQALEALLISLCMKMEMRMVKQGVRCKEASFYIRYLDGTGWDVHLRFVQPVQDGMEMRSYILDRMKEYMDARGITNMFTDRSQSMGVTIMSFVKDSVMQYSLFDNRLQQDVLRKIVYNIKDRFGYKALRRGSETIVPDVMRDAIGFGSVKDLYDGGAGDDADGSYFNNYMIEEQK